AVGAVLFCRSDFARTAAAPRWRDAAAQPLRQCWRHGGNAGCTPPADALEPYAAWHLGVRLSRRPTASAEAGKGGVRCLCFLLRHGASDADHAPCYLVALSHCSLWH